GISTTTSQFTFYNAMVLRPMPHIKDESRVVTIRSFYERDSRVEQGVSFSNYLDFRERLQTLEGFTIWQSRTYNIPNGEQLERVLGAWISTAGFDMLGVKPILGRNFLPD